MTAELRAAVEVHHFAADGAIPNNAACPLLVYRGVLALGGDAASACETVFERHGWGGGWRNGVYPYHHFHSNAHEVLGVVSGAAHVQFGGSSGPVVEVSAGDVVIVPAGVAHKKESATPDLLVIGAYPEGQRPDLCRGKVENFDRAARNVARVPIPLADPVFGAGGPLLAHWRSQG